MKKNFFEKNSKYTDWIAILVSVISVIFALSSCSQSKQAIKEAQNANQIANTANELSNSANTIALGTKKISAESLKITQESRINDLHNIRIERIRTLEKDLLEANEWNAEVYRKLRNKEYIADIYNLSLFLDPFETIWGSWARNEIYDDDIKSTFGEYLEISCNALQIKQATGTKHNGLKELCKRFIPNARINE